MPFTSPVTWTASLVTVDQFNEQIRDNLNALKSPPSSFYNVNQGSDYTTTSTTFTDVDGTNLALSITTAGGDIFVGFVGTIFWSSGAGSPRVFFDITLNGVAQAGDDGIAAVQVASGGTPTIMPVAFVFLIDSPDANTYTLRLRWKTTGSTVGLYAGAGTSNGDLHPQFWVRELS